MIDRFFLSHGNEQSEKQKEFLSICVLLYFSRSLCCCIW